MAIIRFLDKNNSCYQINTPDVPILIYLNEKEKESLLKTDKHGCLILIDNNLEENDIINKKNMLNTKEEPRTMS